MDGSAGEHGFYCEGGMYCRCPETDCAGQGCKYPEPHRHGFACDKECEVCHGR